jgi:hypothetical protein
MCVFAGNYALVLPITVTNNTFDTLLEYDTKTIQLE